MRFALAKDRRVDIEYSVVARLHLFYKHSGAVGYLPVGQAQDLFADDLGDDNALRLVGKGVLVKKVTALARLLFELVEQLVHAAAVLRAHGHDRLEVIKLRVGEYLLHQLVLFL